MFLDNLNFESIFQKWGDSSCISYGEKTLSYSKVNTQSTKLSNKLISAGIKEGSIVAVRCLSADDFFIIFIALIRIKAVVFPIGHDVPFDALNEQLAKVEVNYIITAIASDIKINKFIINTDLNDVIGSAFLLKSEISELNLLAAKQGGFIRFTSGTTGDAKGVFISMKSARERVFALSRALEIKSSDIILNMMPCAYHFIVSLLHFLNSGAHILIPRSNTVPMLLELKSLTSASMVYGTPYHYDVLCGLTRDSFGSNLRLAISTGDALSEGTSSEFRKKFSVNISQGFGLIEVGIPIIKLASESCSFLPTSVGRSYDPYIVKVIKENPEDDTGVLAISGPGMFDAYLSPYKSRDDVLVDGWFITGDRARIVESGEVVIYGRNSAAIKFLGHKVHPLEVETVLNDYPFVKESIVYGVPDSRFGCSIVAKLVLHENIQYNEQDLKNFCRKRLEKYKVPRTFILAKEIEKTYTGKLKRG